MYLYNLDSTYISICIHKPLWAPESITQLHQPSDVPFFADPSTRVISVDVVVKTSPTYTRLFIFEFSTKHQSEVLNYI